ncbi:MAG: DEAD/DEAH box helicase [Acidimicrobiia bacterium]
MSRLDPIATSNKIAEDYRSYLLTSFNFADPLLRSELEASLADGRTLKRGPFVQASPPYVPGRTVRDLADDDTLHPSLATELGDVLPARRPLHRHQEVAISRIQSGRNAIIATGTGSGKTECYLLPIVDRLLRERDEGTLGNPGVRALLLYPMNALANDQLKRIRDLLEPFPEITFGRYVGETGYTRSEAEVTYQQKFRRKPPANELIDRAAIQARPPHILLTNYAMLEYLLLRPRDSSIFDGPTGRHWSFVVLDEVHVYDGARGSEMAMLLRRVRDRVHQSEQDKIRCIATSATLGGGAKDSGQVADFAANLFGEKFEAEDVVLPDRLSLLQPAADEWAITESQLNALHAAWLAGRPHSELIAASGRPTATAANVPIALWALLHNEQHVRELQTELEAGTRPLEELAPVLDGCAQPEIALTKLIDLCIAARRDEQSAALLPARYHLFVRASEGAFVCWAPDHPTDQRRTFSDRHKTCPHCEAVGRSRRVFEVGACRHCGADYLVGAESGGVFENANGDDALVYLLREAASGSDADYDEDEEAADGDAGGSTRQSSHALCLGCGSLSTTGGACTCGGPKLNVTQLAGERGTRPKVCAACAKRSNGEVISRFLPGSDGPVAVLASSLYQALPPVTESEKLSADGRKLLMFADSRQDAAFFAPYLRRTYNRLAERRLLWSIVAADPEPYAMDDLVAPLLRAAQRAGHIGSVDGRSARNTARMWILAEILATDRRQSLDGVGLVELAAPLPAAFVPPTALTNLGFNDDEALDLVRVLLDSIRQAASVELPDEIDITNQHFSPRNTTTFLRCNQSEPRVLAWLPGKGSNRRVDYLRKVFDRRGIEADPVPVLLQLWEDMTVPGGPLASVLRPQTLKGKGTVFALDPARITFQRNDAQHLPYRCRKCRQVWWRSVSGTCPTFRCTGDLEQFTAEHDHHYRSMYSTMDPFPLAVEEHTGQLSNDRASTLQEQFVRGEVNALSCSTTFELGVDLGEVQAVLMRNMPRGPANYVQRAGRAGRRLGSAAMILTFAQRRSHDLHFYERPQAMIDGHVTPPVIAIDNDAIARRHLHAVAFASFHRALVEGGAREMSKVSDFAGSVAAEFERWLRSRPADLGSAVRRLIPPELTDALELSSWGWVDRLYEADSSGLGGWMTAAFEDLDASLEELAKQEQSAIKNKNYKMADAITRTAKTLSDQRLIDFLAQRGILPKYGFPVDVVSLDVSKEPASKDVDLSRDLGYALLEFAPGAQVVAANRLWTSVGLKYRPGKDLPSWTSLQCECGRMRLRLRPLGDDGPDFPDPCECGSASMRPARRFVIPMFGFAGRLDKSEPGDSRPQRHGRIERWFTDFEGTPPGFEEIEIGHTTGRVRTSKRGWVLLQNSGSMGGFSICSWCGWGSETPPKAKKKGERPPHPHAYRIDTECTGPTRRLSLGHRFLTNVVELDLPLRVSQWHANDHESVLAALLSALPAIGISQSDVDGSLSVGPTGQRTLILFDAVPGGAGHARFIRLRIEDLISAAIERVTNCACGEETSCYGCLRTYANQARHGELIRGAARDALSFL